MTWAADLVASVRRVVLLEDRVARLDTNVEKLTNKLSDTRDRVIRLEGLIEGAVRTYRPQPLGPQPAIASQGEG